LQAQQLDYDEAAVRDQVVDTFKHVKVVEWLKVRMNATLSSGVLL
jgi:hypothetical protein